MKNVISNIDRARGLATLKRECKAYTNGEIKMSYTQILSRLAKLGFTVNKSISTERVGKKNESGKYFVSCKDVKVTEFSVYLGNRLLFEGSTRNPYIGYTLATHIAGISTLEWAKIDTNM